MKIFELFREKLDDVMIKTLKKRIVLYGYNRTGQFLEWYADYYHSKKMDYIITTKWGDIPRNFPLFSETLFDFDYQDVKDAVVWLAIPEDEVIQRKLEEKGYIKGETYFPFVELIYGNDYEIKVSNEKDVYYQRKTGRRDIQFMEWLEYIYACNFVQGIDSSQFEEVANGRKSYVISTQKEIFPILDKCHIKPQENDAIFDFGCGKGGALVTFLDYGFQKVGGVEYEKKIYDIMLSNFEKIGLTVQGDKISCIHGDAVNVKTALDQYNWFYYFEPFEHEIFSKTIKNIEESLKRRPRKIHIIVINPKCHADVLKSGIFVLTNQFAITTRQKVVDVFVTKKQYE